MIYLDNCATHPMSESVAAAINAAPWGNSHSIHAYGREARRAESIAEVTILQAIGATDGKILWTTNGSEANKLAIAILCSIPKVSLSHCLISDMEHKSLYQYLQRPFRGFGANNPCQEFQKDQIVALMLVNNELGTIHNVKELKKQNKDILVHCDAVQALGRTTVDVKELEVDTLSLSAHKLGGPKGIGCLWIRPETLRRIQQEQTIAYRGSNATQLIVGFGQAISHIQPTRTQYLLRKIENAFLERLTDEGVNFSLNGSGEDRIAGIINLCLRDIEDSTILVYLLEEEDIYISTGAACNGGDPSHVLENIGLSSEEIASSIRVSLPLYHTTTANDTFTRDIIDIQYTAERIAYHIKENIK